MRLYGVAARLGPWLAAFLLLMAARPSPAAARRVRPLFEPTDLELEDPGVLEADLQFGAIRGSGPARVVVPDFEVDLGLTRNLELDIDGAYAVEGPSRGPFAFDHAAPDSLWVAAKLGLYDTRDPAAQTAFAFGVQAGPKLPVAPRSHGVGAESLLLFGTAAHRTHLVWNAGGFIDAAPDSAANRPAGVELGVDLDLDLDASDRFSLAASVSGVHFVSPDSDQLLTTAGIVWSPSAWVDLSLLSLVGWLAGNDRYGILLGVSPKFRLFH
ncbi:MAG TPA: hypothetical protein VF331_19545 [Polyangiales bacterium]